MRSFSFSKIVVMSVTFYLCIVTPSVSGKPNFRGVSSVSRYSTAESRIKHPLPAHDNHDNASSVRTTPPAFAVAQRMGTQEGNKSTPRDNPRRMSKASTQAVSGNAKTPSRTPTPTKRRRQNDQPTPEPTGEASTETTVYIDGADTFALLLPRNPGELVSNAEEDGVAYCTDGSTCGKAFPTGLITGAAYSAAPDGSYVQITGCMDSSKFPFASNDDGGQFDNRFPNGAQCTFGGYGASFIELVEPSANRFCLRCCKSANDQQNCNSHQDRDGCPTAIPDGPCWFVANAQTLMIREDNV